MNKPAFCTKRDSQCIVERLIDGGSSLARNLIRDTERGRRDGTFASFEMGVMRLGATAVLLWPSQVHNAFDSIAPTPDEVA